MVLYYPENSLILLILIQTVFYPNICHEKIYISVDKAFLKKYNFICND
jgi:hypothetical protein